MRCLLTKLTLFNFPTEYCLHNANYVLLAFCTQACLNNIFNKMFNLTKVQCSCFRSVHIFIVTDVGIKYGVIIQNRKEHSMTARGSCKIYNVQLGSGVIQLI